MKKAMKYYSNKLCICFFIIIFSKTNKKMEAAAPEKPKSKDSSPSSSHPPSDDDVIEEIDEDTLDYTEEHKKLSEESEKRFKEYVKKKEEEKRVELEKRNQVKKNLKRKAREDEEKGLEKFQMYDPHFNPKLRHVKKKIEKEKEKAKLEKPLAPPYDCSDFSEEGIQRINKLKVSIIELIKRDVKNEFNTTAITKYFDIDIDHIVGFIKKDVLTYYRMGLLSFSVRAILYMTGLTSSDCTRGVESVKDFTDLLHELCEVIDDELDKQKNNKKIGK